jgi:phosphonate transport system permease protein
MSDFKIDLPSEKFRRKATFTSVVILVVALLCYYIKFNPFVIFTEFHFLQDFFVEMFPPNYALFFDNEGVFQSILQTLSMAFLGTIYGGLMGTILSFIAANNIFQIPFLRNCSKTFLAMIRVIPSLVVILIFVIAVGPGTFAGVLTLIVTTTGVFGKLFTEVLENADEAPSESIYCVGASHLQVIRYSIIPQVLPAFISNLLYAFDLNMRAAIGLGIFGGGGIGYKLYMAMRVLHYQDATALITVIIVLLLIVENTSNYLRSKLLGEKI